MSVIYRNLTIPQGEQSLSQSGPMIQAVATAASPTYLSDTVNALSLTLSGLLRIDGSGAVQPVSQFSSWTVTANAGTNLNTSALALDASIQTLITSLATRALETSLQTLIGRFSSTTATVTTSAAIPVTPSAVLIVAANANRKGLIVYNNSGNSIYIKYGSAGTASVLTRILATFANFTMEQPIYTGDLYATRNAGAGSAVVTELT